MEGSLSQEPISQGSGPERTEGNGSLKRSWAYQWRIPISTASILAAVGLARWTAPQVEHTIEWHHAVWGAGWLLLTAGVGLRVWAAACLGGKKSTELIRIGPYAACRNPLYLGTLLIAVSQAFFYESLWILIGLVAPLVIYVHGVVPAEERKLRLRLGDEYRVYCEQVPRWVPRWRLFAAGRTLDATTSFRYEVLRSAVWLGLPFLAAVITALRSLR